MVSVCCGCDGFYPWSAFLAGFVGGLIFLAISKLLVMIKIDDPIDAVAVHGGAGNTSSKVCMKTWTIEFE